MKRFLWMIVALVLVGGAYFITNQHRSKSIAPQRVSDFINFLPGKIDNFSINKPGETLDFKKVDQTWYVMVDSIPRLADSSAVNSMIEMITGIEIGAVESENPAKQALYQVDTVVGTRLECRNGDQVLGSFVIGKSAQGYNYSYIRKAGYNQVYRAKNLLSYRFNKSLSGWRDKTFLTIDTVHLAEIEFIYNKEKLTLEKKDSLWQASGTEVSGNAEVDADSLNAYLKFVSDMKVDDFAQESDQEFINCNNPSLELVFSFTSGRSERILFCGNSKNNNRFYLKNEGGDEIYVLYDAKFKKLARKTIYFVPVEKNG